MAEYTTDIPLTTVFTPPASCSSAWTFEAASYNSVSGGLLIQQAIPSALDPGCFPSGFNANGRIPTSLQVFSPGACPVGYSTAQNNFDGSTTTAVCCPSQFRYVSYYSAINTDSQSANFEGCTGTYPSASGSTSVAARSGVWDLSSTVVTGPLLMWAQPVVVAFRPEDLGLSTTSALITISTSAASPSSAVSSSMPASTGGTTPTVAGATISPTGNQAPDTKGSSLSGGAIAGIAIGAAAVLGILLGLAIFFRRPRRREDSSKDATESPPEMQTASYSPGYHGSSLLGALPYTDRKPEQEQRFGEAYADPRYEADGSTSVAEMDGERRRVELA